MVLQVRVVVILRADVRRPEGSFCYASNQFPDLGAGCKNVFRLCKSIKLYISNLGTFFMHVIWSSYIIGSTMPLPISLFFAV